MARKGRAHDLSRMYTFNISHPAVRDRRSRYHAGGPDPEQYHAEPVLRDLRNHATEEAAPLIVARYTALRAWLLGYDHAEPALLEHARETAEAHLEATPPGWGEREMLRRLVSLPTGAEEPCRLLARVAEAAEATGHVAGAHAAWTAACAAALRPGRFDLAAALALDAAGFLRRSDQPDRAAAWERAARRFASAGDSSRRPGS
jgi:hypothetical protein